MKTKILLVVLPLIVLCSCTKKESYHKFDALEENHRWEKSAVKTYDFTIDDEKQWYDLVFVFSHVYDYQYATVPITFTIESPDGKQEKLGIDLMIKDQSGKQIADCSGDICDLKSTIKRKTKFLRGNYKVTVAQNFNGPYLPNVIGVGLNVEVAK